jgi:VWFA-related protein
MRRAVLLALLLAPIALSAQSSSQQAQAEPSQGQQSQDQQPIPGPTFRTGVDVITVDVGVSDDRGRPVSDLRAPDFVVKIDGQVRRVVSADQVRIDVEAAKRQAASRTETFFTSNQTPPAGRMIVIAVDQSNIRAGAARPLLMTAGKFLDRLSPADRVAFVAYPPPGPRIDFTDNYVRIREAMNLVTGNQQRHDGQFNIGTWEARQIVDAHDESTRRAVVVRECGFLAGFELERCAREIELEASNMVSVQRQTTAIALNGLRDLLIDLTFIEGPKALILLSEGLILEGLTTSELDEIVRLAAIGQVSINVMLMDVPRFDVTQAQMPPSATQDRELQVRGLENLASLSRGALFRIIGTGENAFDRLSSELSAYYLLGVEQGPGDRDGKRHRIDVEVKRRGVTLRSRRAFVLSTSTPAKRTTQDRLVDALRTPFGMSELPMRLTSFSYQDPASNKVRVLLSAEIGQAGAKPAEYTVGFVLIDREGRVASSASDKRRLEPGDGGTAPLSYVAAAIVDPGVYSARFAAVDAEGRRGSVVRQVNAWKMSGEEFAVGDLIVADVPKANEPLLPQVEPRVHEGRVAAYVELYASAPATFDRTAVSVEVADDEDGPALIGAAAQLSQPPGSQATTRLAQALVPARMLPPGRYVARVQITRDGKRAGVLIRPFILAPTPGGSVEPGGFVRVPTSLVTSIPKFDRDEMLKPDLIGSMLTAVERMSPAAKDAMAHARAGRYGVAALEALGAGDQPVAMFLRGLDHFTKGQLDQAATQFQNAAGPRREFFPAAFYLGACFAAVGRDQDAAGVWQLAIGTEARPAVVYTMFADARMRAGQPGSVIDVLRPVVEREPDNDELNRRLAVAYLMTGRFAEALPVFDRYLTRHPSDADVLFSAVMAQYEVTTRANVPLSDVERARLTRYAKAYKGPQDALIAKYLSAMQVK